MKKLLYTFTFCLSFFLFAVPTYADESNVIDDGNLFTEEEIANLAELTTTLNEQIKGEVFIYTNTETYSDPEVFTDNFLRNQVGNDNNGAVLMINMNYRDYHFSTSGNMIDYLTEKRLDTIEEQVLSNLSSGNYYQAAADFLTLSSEYVADGVPKGHYRVDRETGKITYYKTLSPLEIFIALLLSGAISLIIFFVIKSRYQLKSKAYRYPYTEKSSLKLQKKEDRLINSFVTTRRIPRNTGNGGGGRSGGGSVTHSSGGGSFGGRGGKF